MLNTAERTLILNRYNKARQEKSNLLKLKKSQRGNNLKEVQQRITTLKKWLN